MTDKTVELVIPNVKDAAANPLSIQVAFDIAVDSYMNVTSGSVSLENPVDLEDYTDIPLSLDSLSYSSSTQQLLASASITLPSSLNNVELSTSAVIGLMNFNRRYSAEDYRRYSILFEEM
ncbi:MAG: hypothetical protein U5K71_08965 [Gracilimonas sp.]|nr:hypothetical protein [Gracilimonas sp.]